MNSMMEKCVLSSVLETLPMKNYLLITFAVLLSFSLKSQNIHNRLLEGAIPILYNRFIYVQGQADGVKGNFIFDTGADNLYYDTIFYSQHRFPYSNLTTSKLGGVGKTPQRVIVILDTIHFVFGNQVYKTTLVPVLKLKPVTGDYADGILGLKCCSNSVLEINYQQQFMKIYPNTDSVNLSGFSKIDFEFVDDRMLIPGTVKINDTVKVEGSFLVDLGMAGTLALSGITANRYKLDKAVTNRIFSYAKNSGVGGESAEYIFRADSLHIGNFSFGAVKASFGIDSTGATTSSKKHLGMIGNEILEKFEVVIDFSSKHLYLKPNDSFNKPFKLQGPGFTYSDRSKTLGGWIVNGFYKNSNAEKSGLQVNDKIISVNNIKVSDIPFEQQKDFLDSDKKVILMVERNDKLYKITFTQKPML